MAEKNKAVRRVEKLLRKQERQQDAKHKNLKTIRVRPLRSDKFAV